VSILHKLAVSSRRSLEEFLLNELLLQQRCWPGALVSASVRPELRVNPFNCITGATEGCQKATGRPARSRVSSHTACQERQHGHGSAIARQSGGGLQHARSQRQQPESCIATCGPDTNAAPSWKGRLCWRAVNRCRVQRKWSAGLQLGPPTLNRCAGRLAGASDWQSK
jgi:hypothetical protein